MAYWLLKSEPAEYGIEDLKREGRALWDGVRNYQARNHLLRMEVGDLCFFYHSSTEPPGVAGLCRVVRTRLPDPSQFDPQSPYFDPKSRPEAPRWWTVEVEYLEDFPLIPLSRLRQVFPPDHPLVRRGNRLSVMPVPEEVARALLALIGRTGSR
ncbi:EVE domain-containing protein [Thermus filiformis]|uniref:Thymocyte nuclear protein 1 n=1 Tax=Thermus filiformis TaxID=276 RepID=A0A0A2WQ48_THEFI|nr:EVE domain-containing protein [Thermus filiformis]KGQ20887.2 thymocyte nuclear protein 1 [Thermus filiformis]